MSTAWLRQRERGGVLALHLITWITRKLGYRAGNALLYPICWYFLAFSPRARRASRDYLQRILGAPAGTTKLFRHFHVFASTLFDRIEILTHGSSRLDIRLNGWPALEAILAQGRGCLLLGSHLGNFEVLRAFGERHQKLAINLVMHEANAQAAGRWLRQMAPELAGRVIALGNAGTLLRVRECLERGEIVAMLGDRVFGSERTMSCEFLGSKASFPAGPMLSAAILGAPVVCFFCLHRAERSYDVYFDVLAEKVNLAAGPRETTLAPWISRYVRSLETHARIAPYNWFNFYDFWKDA